MCLTTDVFLLNTDYTDFTDNLVLPHNGTKASSLDAPPNKNILVIREIRVQNPYAPRLNKDIRVPRTEKNPYNPCNPCSEPLRITELQGISTFSESIRVIREIRVQNPYAPRLNKEIRVSRQKKNPCSDLPSNCLETRIVHCFVGSGHSRAKIRDFI